MKKLSFIARAAPEMVGPLQVYRALPNPLKRAVGPVIFLDHLAEKTFAAGELPAPDGSFAHPHRGIATFSYVVKGELDHYDSYNGWGRVKAGGVQWMNAGNGIVHDEALTPEFRATGGTLYSFQFWVNLPAKNKAEAPDYIPVQAEDLPLVQVEGASVKVLLGEYEGKRSPIPAFTEQFIWHVQLDARAKLTLPTVEGYEYAGYLPASKALVGEVEVDALDYFGLENSGTYIELSNPTDSSIDMLIFGGEPYAEPMVSQGPFVMNSQAEIKQAYADYRNGKYGEIDYTNHS